MQHTLSAPALTRSRGRTLGPALGLAFALGLCLTAAPRAFPAPSATAPVKKTSPATEATVDAETRELEQAFAHTKVYGPDGHPWRIPREDWEGARQRVATNPDWAAWLVHERGEVDRWMATMHDRVTWNAGYWHDMVSPKDGSHLTWTPEIPGEQVSFLHSPSDPHVELTPKLMGGWVCEMRMRNAGMMRRAAALYRLTGDPRYASWAAEQLDFYTQHYSDFPIQRPEQGSRLWYQTLDEAVACTTWIDTVRLLGPAVDAARKERWRSGLFVPAARLLGTSWQRIHNIACWQRSAVAQIALVYDDEALWKEAIDGPFGLRAQLRRGLTPDSLWYEQSFHYNDYVVSAVAGLFVQAGLAGRSAELSREMARTENLMLAPLYLRFPNGMLPNPADGTGIEHAPHTRFLASMARIFPTTLGLSAASEQRDWSTLVDPLPGSPRPPQLPEVKTVNLERSGMALLRRGAWQVFLHVGQLDRSHAQSEALSYSASYGSDDITHDPGTTGYGSPFTHEYYRKGLNHNVPLVDGEGEVPPQRGRLLTLDEATGVIAAEQPSYAPHVHAARRLQVDGSRLTDEVELSTDDGATHALGLALHLQGKASLPAQLVPDSTLAQGRPAAFGYWRDVTAADFADQATAEVQCGATRLRVTWQVPGPFRLWHASTPDVPPARREGFYLETRGAHARFKVVMEAVEPAAKPSEQR